MAVLFDVSDRMIANTREVRGVTGEVLVYAATPGTGPENTLKFKLAA
jgi:hypothetical protein